MKRIILKLLAWSFFLFVHFPLVGQCSIGNPTTNAPLWSTGKTIEKNFNDARRWEETNRDLSPLTSGIYFINFSENGKSITTHKFLKL